MWNKYKYFLAYLLPATVFFGIFAGDYLTFAGVVFSFVLLPALELFFKGTAKNPEPESEAERSVNPFFDVLLYLNIPILYAILLFFIGRVSGFNLVETIGGILSAGILIGSTGINVAHELGHRQSRSEQVMAKILLLPALYMHFFIEHNRGHHRTVGTDEDPVSAKKGEIVYLFWIKAIVGEFFSAWRLEKERLKKLNLQAFSLQNEMIRFQLAQLAYLGSIYTLFGSTALLAAIASALVGVLLLQSINYIEHYGLRRKKLPNGYYEPVLPTHSWNSDHELGRIMLYELTRHSDHHYKSTRKYQILRHFGSSPQLPMGYPAAVLSSLLPPFWFYLMDKRLENMNMG
jgi:alkane 1-monooxygenase